MALPNVPFVPRGGQSRNPLSRLFITVNKHDDETDEQFMQLFKQKLTSIKCARCVTCTYQFERGEQGRLHLHAALRLRRNRRMRILQAVQFCRETDSWDEGRPQREVRVQRVIDWPSALAYVTKDDTRVSGPHGDVPPPTRESYDLSPDDLPELYAWQKTVVTTLTVPDPVLPDQWRERTIFWLWEADGAVGKTMLLRYLVVNHNAVLLQGAARHCKAVAYKHPADIYVFPVPRSANDPCLATIEDIKDGIFMSGFGTEATGMVCRRSPQILVLANRRCSNMAGLSRDRWCEVEISPVFRALCDDGKERINLVGDNEMIDLNSISF